MFQKDLEAIIKKQLKWDIQLETPKNKEHGDLSLPCFKLKKSPEFILTKLTLPNYIKEAKIIGTYLNFYLKPEYKAKKLLEYIPKFKKTGKRIMLEYSQANTHKAFHVGHIRGTSIGEALARILEFTGNKVLRVNYQGDTGMHVAKWIWCYNKFHKNEEPPQQNKTKWISHIYVEAVQNLGKDEKLEKEIRELNKKIDRRDKSVLDIWKKSRKWSLDEFETIYKDLNTRFDYYFFERDMEKSAKELSKQLIEDKIAVISDKATIMDLKKENLSIWVLLRDDGTPLYSSKDLVLAKKKFEKYKINKSIYIVGAAQTLHFQQCFKTLELMGFKNYKNCYHIPYSEVRLPYGKMSSRTGENILYQEMLEELFNYSKKETKLRHREWSETKINKNSKEIAITSIKFTMLHQDNNKNITFDLQKSLDFQGETGPYIQYVHARCSSILKNQKLNFKINYKLLKTPEEINLIDELSKFEEVILQSSEHYKINLVANYTIKLAKTFNEFYHNCQVLKSEPKLKEARLKLVEKTQKIIALCLNLLGINPIKEM